MRTNVVNQKRKKRNNTRTRLEQKAEMYRRIARHGGQIMQIFGLSGDATALMKKIMRIERRYNYLATMYCNGTAPCGSGEKFEALTDKLEKSFFKIIGTQHKDKIYFNSDPRGYSLKFTEEYSKTLPAGFYKDWGGYGIICPTFDGQ